MADIEKIKAKIAAMSAKTVENGATEEEAMAAANIMLGLLDKHGLTIEEIEDFKRQGKASDQIGFDGMPVGPKGFGPLQIVLNAVLNLFSVQALHFPGTAERKPVMILTGFDEDRLCVIEMLATIRAASEHGFKTYLKDNPKLDGRTMRRGFMQGFMKIINHRLLDILEERARAKQGLMVLKMDLIVQKLDELTGGAKRKPMKDDVILSDNLEALGAGVQAGLVADIGIGRKLEA